MAGGSHLFPSRTQKLSLHTLMVLGWQRPGRRCSRRIPQGLCMRVHDPNPFLSSSMAEHSAVNRRVVSSSLTWGAMGSIHKDTAHFFMQLALKSVSKRLVMRRVCKAKKVFRASTEGRKTAFFTDSFTSACFGAAFYRKTWAFSAPHEATSMFLNRGLALTSDLNSSLAKRNWLNFEPAASTSFSLPWT